VESAVPDRKPNSRHARTLQQPLLPTPATFYWQLAAFMLFRYFDITKPQPARYFDEHVKNGFGVMADDLVAAGYTLLTLALLKVVLA
jgi:phosphatidylglycerophosphatase A